MQSLLRRVSVFLFVLALVGVTASQVWAATYSVTIDETKFVPATLKVKTGDSITFINTTDATQSAKTTSTTGFNTGNIGPGASKTVTVNTAGTFSYSSTYDPSLTGTVTVEGSTTTSTSSATTTTTTTKGGQDMPVSGTTEVLMALIGGGLGFIAFGFVSNRFNRRVLGAQSEENVSTQGVVEVKPLSSEQE